jgi:hypothetical protein
VLAWRPGQSAPKVLKDLLPALQSLTRDVIVALPGEPQAALLVRVAQVYGAVSAVLALMIGGA